MEVVFMLFTIRDRTDNRFSPNNWQAVMRDVHHISVRAVENSGTICGN